MVRIKERYLLVHIVYPPEPTKSTVPSLVVHHQPTVESLTPQALLKGIRAEVASLYGDYGSGALDGNLSVKYLSCATSTVILRCSRANYQLLWSTLTFMGHVPVRDGRPCIFRVVRVSGTISKIQKELIRQDRALLLAAKEQVGNTKSSILETSGTRDQTMLDVTDDYSDDEMDAQDG